ncbi:MAG: hypothetical protein ABI948_09315, partial [Thermoleophilia bacterium]
MAFALADAWTKLARAEQHLQTLNTEIRGFLDGHHYSFTKYFDPEGSRYFLRKRCRSRARTGFHSALADR